jgi:2-polyprenyl-3-methyl-5-hydroxy-6-metoxy-1,4-benzoquinol methylase
METVPCPLCGSAVFVPFLDVADRFDASGKKRWTLVRSCKSGLIMLNPRPELSEMAHYYPAGRYEPHLDGNDPTSSAQRIYLAARKLLLGYKAGIVLKNHRKPLQALSILEVGCSTGELLGFLNRKKGIPVRQLAGIETDVAAAKHAGTRFGLEIHGTIPGETWKARKFDRIVLWHALEHIHAIGETLDTLAGLLERGGIMIITLPNPGSRDAEIYRENWIAWDAPRHLCHFTSGSLEKLLEIHHFEITGSMPYLPDTVYNVFHSEKLACMSEKRSFNALRKAGAVLKSLQALPGDIRCPSRASGIVYFVRKT